MCTFPSNRTAMLFGHTAKPSIIVESEKDFSRTGDGFCCVEGVHA